DLSPTAGLAICGDAVTHHVVTAPIAGDDEHGGIPFALEGEPAVLRVAEPLERGIGLDERVVRLANLDQAPEHGFEIPDQRDVFERPVQDVVEAGIVEAAFHGKLVSHEKEWDAGDEKAERRDYACLLFGPVVTAPAKLRYRVELALCTAAVPPA